MKIISISGLDGSGKSTQINLLKEHLEKQGKKVFYFHAIAFSFPQKLKEFKQKHCFTNSNKTQKMAQEKGVTEASWLKVQLRKIALFIDLIRFKSFKKNLKKQGYDFIVSDRYFYDSIINIAYLQNSPLPPNSYHLIPNPDFAFFLNTDPEKIMSRDRVPDQGLEYLKTKKELYEKFANLHNLQIIDGNQEKELVFEEILSSIKITD